MMYEFNGWFSLAEATDGEDDDDVLAIALKRLASLLLGLQWPTGVADLVSFNGSTYLRLTGLVEKVGPESGDVDRILDFVSSHLPGSYGLLHERFDQKDYVTPGPDAFRVRVMARGVVQVRLDPFLPPLAAV